MKFWEALIYYQRYYQGSSLEDAFRAFRPDIFVIDSGVEGFMSDEPAQGLYAQDLGLPKEELYDFLGRHARLVAVDDTANRTGRSGCTGWNRTTGRRF